MFLCGAICTQTSSTLMGLIANVGMALRLQIDGLSNDQEEKVQELAYFTSHFMKDEKIDPFKSTDP